MAILVSNAFERALKYSHRIAFKIEIYHAGILKTHNLKVTGGYVTIKRDGENRRTAYFTLTDDTGEIAPDGTIDSLINLYDCEFKLFRGITYSDGSVELVSLGLFSVRAIEVAESGQGLYIKVTGADYSKKVQDAKLTTTFTVTSGSNAVLIIKNLLIGSFPTISFGQVDITTHQLPSMGFGAGSDPWLAATKLANGIGFDLYFNNEGKCVLKNSVNPLNLPVTWEYVEGATCTMLSQQKYMDSDEAWNWIVITGENTGTGIIRAEAKDNNILSPTYWNGPYGKRVHTISSSEIKSEEQAQAKAERELRLALGKPDMLYMVTIPNPAIDIDDIVYTRRTNAKTDGYYIVDQLTIPLQHDAAANLGVRRRLSPNA